MTPLEIGLVAALVFALLAIAAFQVFRQRAKLKIKGPAGVGFDLDASNDQKAAIRMEDVSSEDGGFSGTDLTGRGFDGKKIHAKKDIRVKVESKSPKE